MRARIIRTCSSCLQAQPIRAAGFGPQAAAVRTIKTAPPLSSGQAVARKDEQDDGRKAGEEEGVMSRRLVEMTEESIDSGGSSAARNIEAAGFSEELKKQLESRITDSAFRSQNQRAFAEAEMPSSAGKGTRDQATAQPWTGSESLHDSALRMLDDSHKRLRGTRAPRIPQPTNLRPRPKKFTSTGERLANARDRTSIYAAALSNEMTDEERNQMRKELQERFSPGARPMPTTLQGLTSLANERIEDAIARGQFKNIPRGKGKNVERDYNASSPFLDTTEYFLNKIIQKQEIVPPWIEKQQELVKSVASFRGRLRNDWKRHAARMIASEGGSLESQIRRAQAYALAEERVNPIQTKVESLSRIDGQGNLSTVTVQEPPSQQAAAAEEEIPPQTAQPIILSTITITEIPAKDTAANPPPPPPLPPTPPFRDPTWQSTEHTYHTLSITTLNTLTRSYNLLAPSLAQKPYYTLSRELNRCYADVASLLPEEIRLRGQTFNNKKAQLGEAGVLNRFGARGGGKWRGHVVERVRDEDLGVKGYGFRQFWRDLFGVGS